MSTNCALAQVRDRNVRVGIRWKSFARLSAREHPGGKAQLEEEMAETALAGTIVTESGTRIGVGVCGSLLRQLGATVILVERADADVGSHTLRRQLSAGKKSFAPHAGSAGDAELLQRLLARSDVILTSSDIDDSAVSLPVGNADEGGGPVVCDITAFGSTGPLAKQGYSDLQVQAFSGIVDTTGMADGQPVPIGVPIVEFMTGTYAAAATLAALRVKRLSGIGQLIDMALYDCAFASLFTFMNGVLHLKKSSKSRVGNRHPLVAPWNLYRANDGWVSICAGNQSQWQRLCKIIGRPDLDDETTNTQERRMARIVEIDAAIEHWTSQHSAGDCIKALADALVPSGPFVPIREYPQEANLDHRQMIHRLFDPVIGREIVLPGSPLRMSITPGLPPDNLPAPDSGREHVERVVESQGVSRRRVAGAPQRPLSEIRVVEVGQYTTAPLTARHLANLGAEVIKIEPPGGADGRAWHPVINGVSMGFRAHNADKRSLVLDLKSESGRRILRCLIENADVLVENLKPGTLAKLGFSPAQLAAINPRLVYCAISGFGSESLYANRPAFDMIIQSMSGFMDAVGSGDLPLKSGISTSDLMGAEMGITAILGALEFRDRTGRGQYVDLSMQDITAWVSQAAWNRTEKKAGKSVFGCADGYVACDADAADVERKLQASAARSLADLKTMNRVDAAALLNAAHVAAAPVFTVPEAVVHRQTEERRLWFTVTEDGNTWPLFASPLRLMGTPPTVRRLGPLLNKDGPAILQQFGFLPDEAGPVDAAQKIGGEVA
jgi:crotonobetainyl-CoA:carnitine CoA-transferase CaiB-like acyl-CoA transferase